MDWFRHDINAHDDIKIKKLLKKHGFSALGVYWFLVELLICENGRLDYSEAIDEVTLIDGLSEDEAKTIINNLIGLGLLFSDGSTIGSHRADAEIKYDAECRQKRAEAGRKGGIAKASNANSNSSNATSKPSNANSKPSTIPDHTIPIINNPPISKDIVPPKGEKVSVSRTKNKKDIPTLEEVKALCAERKNSVDPEEFIDYYKSQDWNKANGEPLTDWRAGVRTWERKNKEKGPRKPKTICNDKDVFLAQSKDGRFEL